VRSKISDAVRNFSADRNIRFGFPDFNDFVFKRRYGERTCQFGRKPSLGKAQR
jgi:hypothetical protein